MDLFEIIAQIKTAAETIQDPESGLKQALNEMTAQFDAFMYAITGIKDDAKAQKQWCETNKVCLNETVGGVMKREFETLMAFLSPSILSNTQTASATQLLLDSIQEKFTRALLIKTIIESAKKNSKPAISIIATGGGAQAISDILEPGGASKIFRHGEVPYDQAMLEKRLGYPLTRAKDDGLPPAVSAQVAADMLRDEKPGSIALTGSLYSPSVQQRERPSRPEYFFIARKLEDGTIAVTQYDMDHSADAVHMRSDEERVAADRILKEVAQHYLLAMHQGLIDDMQDRSFSHGTARYIFQHEAGKEKTTQVSADPMPRQDNHSLDTSPTPPPG
jgi:nicotinamide mononucleotide (NMN) deamidase PncC